LARFCKGFFGCFEFFFRFDFEGDTAIGLAPEMKGKLYGRDGEITRGGDGWTTRLISGQGSGARFDFCSAAFSRRWRSASEWLYWIWVELAFKPDRLKPVLLWWGALVRMRGAMLNCWINWWGMFLMR
jgi:hypothetical protein